MCRPACRIIHTGVRSDNSPRATRNNNGSDDDDETTTMMTRKKQQIRTDVTSDALWLDHRMIYVEREYVFELLVSRSLTSVAQ
jgi:hypothetical protein